MVEIRRGWDGARGADRLPWLEPVEDEDVDHYVEASGGYGGVILAAVGVLIGIAVLTVGVVWYRNHLAATADIGQIIRAPNEPYKVRPAEPGGMQPDKNNEVAYNTSTGQDIDSPLDLSALPEAPVGKRDAAAATPKPAPMPQTAAARPIAPPPSAPVTANIPVRPEPVEKLPSPSARQEKGSASTGSAPTANAQPAPPAAAAGPSATIQLGAFSTSAKADQVWRSLSGRFAYLKGLEKLVVPVASGDKTLYRLRAAGPGAGQYCARLRVAGETCSAI